MTLRLRLVASLVGLLTVGLAIFGVTTYAFYARSQYERLDNELQEQARLVGRAMLGAAKLGGYLDRPGPTDGGNGGSGPGDGLLGARDLVADLRSTATGMQLVPQLEPLGTEDRPDLPEVLEFDGHQRWLDVGSADGGTTEWRVLLTPVEDHGVSDYFVAAAVPKTTVQASLARLAFTELVAALGLLILVAFGAWLVMRRGLRPLERMASTASTLTAGSLDTRVTPADERSEVGQLGLALNTMLGRLEESFAEREATEQRLRQFLADASHELRTPLTSIQGFAELFRLGAESDEADLKVTMRRIEEESGRMQHLVDDLLLLARLDQTRPLERRPIDLAVVAADACTAAVAVDPSRTVTLDAPTPVVVQGDDDHLRQAVGNLVANAIRHTPAGTALEVGVHRGRGGNGDRADADGAEAVVTVRDHGEGLDADALDHAFDRFWQGDPSRADAGAGLGLSIVAAIAVEHGGSASVANAVDGGAIFTLRLPATPQPG